MTPVSGIPELIAQNCVLQASLWRQNSLNLSKKQSNLSTKKPNGGERSSLRRIIVGKSFMSLHVSALSAGIVRGEAWFSRRGVVCNVVATVCDVTCFVSLLSIMSVGVNRYFFICKYQVRTCLNSRLFHTTCVTRCAIIHAKRH